MNSRTCKITNGKPFIPQREGRPHYNCYHPGRKRLLAQGRHVGRKARQMRATA